MGKNEECSDIAPMNACQLLLGMLLHYYRRDFYDGFLQIYAFKEDDAMVMFPPLQTIEFSTSKKDVVLLCPMRNEKVK